MLFRKSGCNVASWIAVLDTLMSRYDVNTLVPGHGPLSNAKALATMRDYFVSIGDAIGDPQKLAALKEKYKSYTTIPGMSSLEQTMAVMVKERKAEKQ